MNKAGDDEVPPYRRTASRLALNLTLVPGPPEHCVIID